MTRGKFGVRAERTRDINVVVSEVESQRSAIVRLTAQNKSLAAELATQRETHRERARVLEAQLAEGTSSQVEALQARITELTDQVGVVRTEGKEIRQKWDKMFDRLKVHYSEAHGLGHLETVEAILALLGQENVVFLGNGEKKPSKREQDGRVAQIQRARGQRK